jgi:DNA-binding transcriptional LysR family regulator
LPVQVRHIRYVIAAADHGSFRRAADRAWCIQESAISRRVRDLEDRLGAPLFTRSAGGVQLTLAGQALRTARPQGALADRNGPSGGELRFGAAKMERFGSGSFPRWPPASFRTSSKSFGQRHNAVRLSFADGNPAEHVAAVRQHQLDVAFSDRAHELAGLPEPAPLVGADLRGVAFARHPHARRHGSQFRRSGWARPSSSARARPARKSTTTSSSASPTSDTIPTSSNRRWDETHSDAAGGARTRAHRDQRGHDGHAVSRRGVPPDCRRDTAISRRLGVAQR